MGHCYRMHWMSYRYVDTSVPSGSLATAAATNVWQNVDFKTVQDFTVSSWSIHMITTFHGHRKQMPHFTTFRTFLVHTHTHTHTRSRLTALFPGLSGWASTKKVKPIWFSLKRDSERQWHQLGHMQVCISLHTDNHASTPPLSFFYRPDALPAAQPTASKHWRK